MTAALALVSDDSDTLVVHSRLFGSLNVPRAETLRFPDGLPGFPDARRFALLAAARDAWWLQSTDLPGLCFLIVDIARVIPGGWPSMPGALGIVTLPAGATPATVNLRAPLFIDAASGTARQVIPVEWPFSTTHPFDLGALLEQQH